MLQEAFDGARRDYQQWLQQEDNREGTFAQFVQQTRPEHAWFIQQAADAGFQEEWAAYTKDARDIEAFHASGIAWSDAKIEAYNRNLSGKLLIPQPFGELRNFYQPESGFCISKFMVIEVAVALVMVLLFSWLGRRVVRGGAPQGRLWNMLEVFLVYLRDNVARPAIGQREGDRFVPLLWTIFMFVLLCNLCGLLPWVGAPTGAFAVTSGLALVTFATSVCFGMRKFGPIGFFANLVPTMELPIVLAIPIKLMLLVIELLGFCIKHAVLAIRLLANMVAGHLVLLGIMGLAFGATAAAGFADSPDWQWGLTAVISIAASTLFCCLELFVAFLQAYIFTFLSALFIGASIHHH
jgi:F-type H+-transporting ATPase subunit a